MKENISQALCAYIQDYAAQNRLPALWQTPIIKYASANDPLFPKLRELVVDSHQLPQDFLPGAVSVLSWFIPFLPAVSQGNEAGDRPSPQWHQAYTATNAMAAQVNQRLCQFIQGLGYDAAVPVNAGTISPQQLVSHWSQRHVAYIAGHGTFGRNNLLISDQGCAGRYYSIVTTLPVPPDSRPEGERCLHKRDGSCGLCMARCPMGALSPEGFLRERCYARCMENMALQGPDGEDVCGKCLAGLPCSHRCPP